VVHRDDSRICHDRPGERAAAHDRLSLAHLSQVVITSVDRDDLPDGGAFQFVRCSEAMLMPGAAAALAAALTYISRITVGKAGLTKDCVLKGNALFGLGKRQFGSLI
jgi:hypothetical protein